MTFKLFFVAVEVELFVNRKHNIVTDIVMTSQASNQVLFNVGSYHFYDITFQLNNSNVI